MALSGIDPSLFNHSPDVSLWQAGTTAVVGGFLLARSVHSRRSKKLQLQLVPRARRSDHTDEYFGHTVEDPYRWLERERRA